MNNVSFPIQLVTIIRRLVNAISTISLTNQYVLTRIQADDHPESPAGQSGSCFPLLDGSPWMPSRRWDWLATGDRYDWASIFKLLGLNADDSRGVLRPGYSQPAFSSTSTSDIKGPVDASTGVSEVVAPEELRFNASSLHIEEQEIPAPVMPSCEAVLEAKDTIHRLMSNPALLNPTRAPRYPIVLCHGLYGFDVRGPSAFPSLRYHYWSNVLSILRKIGADVIVTAVPGTGFIASRAEKLDHILQQQARGRGVNLMAHSMGGLDCRHLITHIRPTNYAPLSLTTISTPHRGSPFMDWCAQYLGLGRQTDLQLTSSSRAPPTDEKSPKRDFTLSLSSLPSSFTTLILSYLDSPAYANLRTSYLNTVFNPTTPDDPHVKYFSVVSRIDEVSIWHPLWLPKMVLDDAERRERESLKARASTGAGGSHPDPDRSSAQDGTGVQPWEQDDLWGNDGLVTVQSARWGEFLGILEGCDHWDVRGCRGSFMEFSVDLPSVPSIPLGALADRVGAEGWALGDWSRLVGAWSKRDNDLVGEFGVSAAVAQSTGAGAEESSPRETKAAREQTRQRDRDDPVVKASTDKLSVVFDWLVEQVPSPTNWSPSNSKTQQSNPARRDIATRMDLERFFVALARKLYDEGL